MDRWAFLAHETGECHKILELLAHGAPNTCNRIFLCSGHRHGRSRVGHVVPKASGTPDERLYIMESAALFDSHFDGTPSRTNPLTMLALSLDATRSLRPCIVSLT